MSETFQQLDPNFVIAFSYSKDNLTELLTELSAKGLNVLTRPGHDRNTVYAFTRVERPQQRSKANDSNSMKDDEETKRGLLYRICEPLKFVQSITPIQDLETRKKLDSTANTLIEKSLFLPSNNDLIHLSHLTQNPRQILYFAYFKTYIQWLLPISLIGVLLRVLPSSSEFNITYSISLIAWSLLFTSTWIYKVEPSFVTKLGKVEGYFEYTDKKLSSPYTVLCRKLFFLPIALLFALSLISFQFVCFFIEIFITQFYSGPLGSILALIPTVLLSVFVPILTMFYNKFFVDKLVEWENGPNPAKSKTEKNFILIFLTCYMPLLITLFFYLPMGYKLTPEIKAVIAEWGFRYRIALKDSDFMIDINRYRKQFFYFTVTNQIVVMSMENLVPIVMDIIVPLVQSDGKQKKKDVYSFMKATVKSQYPREFSIWKKVASYHTSAYGEFSVDDNFRKIIIQFGYVAMFSTIWPLAPLICIIFNFVIYKADLWRALKKCKPSSNPNDIEVSQTSSKAVNVSADPWDSILEMITWIGATVCPTVLIMYRYCGLPGVGLQTVLEKRDLWYRQSPIPYSWTTILIVAVFSEHVALLSYFYLKNLWIAAKENFTHGFVPAIELQEPPKVDLSAVVKETVSFMNQISNVKQPVDMTDNDSKSSKSRKDISSNENKLAAVNNQDNKSKQEPTQHNSAREKKPHLSSKSNGTSRTPTVVVTSTHSSNDFPTQPQAIANPVQKTVLAESAHGPLGRSAEIEPPSTENTMKDSLAQLEKDDSSEDFSVAGATVPETIPTSKNYHLRYDKDGNAIKSSDSNQSSKSSLVAESPAQTKTKPEQLNGHHSDSKVDNDPPKRPTGLSKKQHDKAREAHSPMENGVETLDPGAALRVIQPTDPMPNKPLVNSVKYQEPGMATAAAAVAIADPSRTSSQVNAVQQFGRDMPTSIKSAKSGGAPASDHQNPSLKRSDSVKSKTAASTHTQRSTVPSVVPSKKSAVHKRSSFDNKPKETSKEHKSKHKLGLLQKLKKKL